MSQRNTECPFESIEQAMAFAVKDWSLDRRDAWIYGIVHGWDDYEELCEKHGWSKEAKERLIRLHNSWNNMKYIGNSSSDLKAEFIGEFFEEIEETDPETDEEHIRKIPISWTTTKEIPHYHLLQ